MVRRIWRVLRLLVVFVSHTVYASLAVRLRPEAERPAYRAHRQRVGMALVARILGLRIAMGGAPPAARPMLYVCNHLGLLDTVVLASRMHVAFAAKAEVRRWPLLGWVCRTVGVLFVERERPTTTSRFVRQVRERLHDGVSVLVFPEGTTSHGEMVMPFKTGAFEAVAAAEDGAVLPLCLRVLSVEGAPARWREATWAGNAQSFLAHAWHLAGLEHVHLHVGVGAPVPAAGRDRKALARLAHRAVSDLAARPSVEAA